MKAIATGLALAVTMGAAAAQELPCSQYRLIVPYPAGGATDVATRILAERLDAATKRPFVVENRGGAAGNIGTVAAINAPPDGCTVLINATVIATFPHSFSKLAYDPFKDLAPVGGIGITPVLVVAAPSAPANDMKSLIEWAKSKPGGLNYSTAGYGLQQHLSMEDVAKRSGVSLTHVAYKGGGTAMTDLMTARLDFGAFLAGTTKTLVDDGKLKALAIVAEKRSALTPNIPTTTEQGFPGMDSAATHFMMYAPAATPKAAIDSLGAVLHKVVSDPDLKQRFAKIGFDPTPMSAAEVTASMRQLSDKMAPLIKELKIRLD